VTAALVVSLLVSLAALAISGASLWHSALKPAEIALEYLPEHSQGVAGGGVNEIPSVHRLRLTFAVTNTGARAGLLASMTINVTAVGAPEFATGVVGPFHEAERGPVIYEVGVGGKVSFPRTIEAGDVRSFEIAFELEGPFRSETFTQYQHTPSRDPLAQLLADLKRVDLTVSWRYRRRAAFAARRTSRTGTETISLPASDFREPAIELWKNQDRAGLVEIASSGSSDPG
jgi:hypothetical protein